MTAINTEWDVFRHPEFEEIAAALKHKLISHGRNLYDPKNWRTWLYLPPHWSSQ
jgi:UDP-glucose 6-dehydrogenase